jgi:hypothetical protein
MDERWEWYDVSNLSGFSDYMSKSKKGKKKGIYSNVTQREN